MEDAHEDAVVKIDFVKVDLENQNEADTGDEDITKIKEDILDSNGKLVMISASKDGKIKLWNLQELIE